MRLPFEDRVEEIVKRISYSVTEEVSKGFDVMVEIRDLLKETNEKLETLIVATRVNP